MLKSFKIIFCHILETLNNNCKKKLYGYIHSVQIYSVPKFITVHGIWMYGWMSEYKSRMYFSQSKWRMYSLRYNTKLKLFENTYFCPEQWSMVRPTTYLVHGIWMYGWMSACKSRMYFSQSEWRMYSLRYNTIRAVYIITYCVTEYALA